MTRRIKVFVSKGKIRRSILDKTARDKDIIFGARSIQKQVGTFSRSTQDFDIFTAKPRASSVEMDKKLDKVVGFNFHYVKKGKNPGTWKVKNRGRDFRKGNRDDEGVIDYTKTPIPKPKSILIKGVRFRILREEAQAKRKAIRDPKFAFRKSKDLNDLNRIQTTQNASMFFNSGVIRSPGLIK